CGLLVRCRAGAERAARPESTAREGGTRVWVQMLAQGRSLPRHPTAAPHMPPVYRERWSPPKRLQLATIACVHVREPFGSTLRRPEKVNNAIASRWVGVAGLILSPTDDL